MIYFAEQLDKYMKSANLSDEILAGQIGVTKMTVHNWRTGKNKNSPSREKVLKCAYLLELTPKQRMDFFTMAGMLVEVPKLLPVVGTPIIKPYQFFGRKALLSDICWAWNKVVPESIIIIGPKRSGKTSVLNYLKNINHSEYYRSDQPQGWLTGWLPYHLEMVFIDFRDANMFQPETLMIDILQQLNLTVPSPCELATFSSIIKNELTKAVVILMDNLEIGLKMTALDENFWLNMAFLGSHEQLSFVATSTVPLNKSVETFDKPCSFFELFGHHLQLEAFTQDEARELLTDSPKIFSSEEIESMLEESNCWPEPLQKLCDTRLRKMSLRG